MTTPDCESIQMSAMALADGELSPLPLAEVEAHLAGCANCRQEAEGLQSLAQRLTAQQRLMHDEDVWQRIAPQLAATARRPRVSWRVLALLGLALLGGRTFELIAPHDLGLWFGLVFVAVIVVAFALLKENPFRINTELQSERL